MSGALVEQVCSPPELPLYLKNVCELKSITGAPSDEELIGIHAVIQVANRVVDVQGVGDFMLLARLSEHLFNAQMARYRGKQLGVIFPEYMIYTPPTLPAHVSVRLEPVTGAPSEEEVIKVQEATRSYQQFSNAPSLFDPRVNMELSQHLFDIQMARYMQRAKQNPIPVPRQTPGSRLVEQTTDVVEDLNATTNNIGTGANAIELIEPGRVVADVGIRDALEASNRLAEQANRLAERANALIERSNQLMEQPSQLTNQPKSLAEQPTGIVGRLTEHLERFDRLAERLIKPTDAIGDTLKKMNRVLVWIQHAIVRNRQDNTITAFDCLVNEDGEIPALSLITGRSSFKYVSADNPNSVTSVNPVIGGATRELRIPNEWLGRFVRFYGVAEGLVENENDENISLKTGKEAIARIRLRQYLSACLG
ncbi:unnamed protein product [Rhizoctonia solani]|uniref:Laminin domain protein n=1 Tax=Rhizoctonia solani TaxID=456999 RepID=A0A8H3ARU7_9AGAM|nr:unnamed protein product [Rhizoctonia solani]